MAKKKTISINCAPVLTLWAYVLARRLGFSDGRGSDLGKGGSDTECPAKELRRGAWRASRESSGSQCGWSRQGLSGPPGK
jgi:hypothetical protein